MAKKNHTGVLLNYTAIAPSKWKFGLIICLLKRIWDICSDNNYFQQEVEKLKTMFLRNGYPVKFLNSAFEQFQNSKNGDGTKKSDDPNVDKVYIKIPFIGAASVKFGKSLAILFKDTFALDVVPVLTFFKVKAYFSLKSRPFKLSC